MESAVDANGDPRLRESISALLARFDRYVTKPPFLEDEQFRIPLRLAKRSLEVVIGVSGWVEIQVPLDPVVPPWLEVRLVPLEAMASGQEHRQLTARVASPAFEDVADPYHAAEWFRRLPPSFRDEIDDRIGRVGWLLFGRDRRLELPIMLEIDVLANAGWDHLVHALRFACRSATALEEAWRLE